MAKWDAFKIDIPGSVRRSGDGHAFDEVFHVAHLRASRRILEDGYLRAGLVNDGSLLDETRTCVTFMSANSWTDGSVYGTVRWTYSWPELVANKRFYWVEARTNNAYPIYRILVSDRDPDELPALTPYDPVVDEGPLRTQGGVWYRNSMNKVSEFLFDGDLRLDDCKDFDFVRHHPKFCYLRGSCSEKHYYPQDAASQTMAFVFGNGIRSLDAILERGNKWDKSRRFSSVVDDGLAEFYRRLGTGQKKPAGDIHDPDESVAIVRGAMALYGTGQFRPAKDLIWQLRDVEVLEAAIVRIVNDHFETNEWTFGW
jgi:hypothetical protein